jgi:hypothetical protein
MGIGRTTFYDMPDARASDAIIVAEMKTICDEFEAYGYRRVDAELRHRGLVVKTNPQLGVRSSSPNIRSRWRAMQACREFGLSPLGVLLENMRRWHDRALNLEAQVQQLIDTGGDEQTLEQARALLVAAHERAVKYAVAAAPYCHPRVSSVAPAVEDDRPIPEITSDMTLEQKQRAYAEQLKRLQHPA